MMIFEKSIKILTKFCLVLGLSSFIVVILSQQQWDSNNNNKKSSTAVNDDSSSSLLSIQLPFQKQYNNLRKLLDVTDPSLYKLDRQKQISRTNKLILVHVPKTGGSTIEKSVLFDDAQKYHPIGGHWNIDQLLQDSRKRLIDDSFTVMSMVRHPCERFISAFHYLEKNGNDGDKLWYNTHIGESKHDITIEEFIAGVMDDTDWSKELSCNYQANPTVLEMHFRPQWSFLFHERSKDFGVDKLFCQEHFDDAINWLNKHYGNPFKGSSPPPKLQLKHESCSDLPEEMREVIERHYAIDYCVFGYEFGKDGIEKAQNDVCIGGKITTKEEFTMRLKECKDQYESKESE